jgi:chromosome segregation ATPase
MNDDLAVSDSIIRSLEDEIKVLRKRVATADTKNEDHVKRIAQIRTFAIKLKTDVGNKDASIRERDERIAALEAEAGNKDASIRERNKRIAALESEKYKFSELRDAVQAEKDLYQTRAQKRVLEYELSEFRTHAGAGRAAMIDKIANLSTKMRKFEVLVSYIQRKPNDAPYYSPTNPEASLNEATWKLNGALYDLSSALSTNDINKARQISGYMFEKFAAPRPM